MKITNNFVFFWDGWLSNFYPCRIIFDSKVFKSSEQLFMYLKALYFGDLEVAEKIYQERQLLFTEVHCKQLADIDIVQYPLYF